VVNSDFAVKDRNANFKYLLIRLSFAGQPYYNFGNFTNKIAKPIRVYEHFICNCKTIIVMFKVISLWLCKCKLIYSLY